jgi:hypothetical protein
VTIIEFRLVTSTDRAPNDVKDAVMRARPKSAVRGVAQVEHICGVDREILVTRAHGLWAPRTMAHFS